MWVLGTLLNITRSRLSFLFFFFAVVLCGFEIFKAGFLSTLKLKFSEKTLITIASLAAIFIGNATESLFLLIFFKLGETLEDVAKSESRGNMNKISKIMPDTAHLFLENNEKIVSATSLKVGDVFVVYPFERIPCDGIVLEGTSSVNMSNITGESLPIDIYKGTKVFSGSVNMSGTIKIKAEKVAAESFAGKILKLIENGTKNKTKTENFISMFSQKYTVYVIFTSFLIFFISLFLKLGNFESILRRALTFLVASCPCSIVISVPLAFFYGIGKSAKKSILFKGSKYIETLAKIDTIFFDKTGTITEDSLKIDNVHSFCKLPKEKILYYCANLEFYSTHPIAKSLKEKVNLKKSIAKNVLEIPGFGVKGEVDGHNLICGNLSLVKESKIDITQDTPQNLLLYLVIDNKISGGISFKDSIRKSAKTTVKELCKLGIRSIILSGDKIETTKRVAKECAIKDFFGDLLPQGKLDILKNFKSKGYIMAFVGDGVNDAPSLIFADCGISMGLGSSAAIDSSGVILLNNDISLLPESIKISRKVMNTIKFNVYFAVFFKFFVMLISLFFPVPMYLAVFADVGINLISILNALKIK